MKEQLCESVGELRPLRGRSCEIRLEFPLWIACFHGSGGPRGCLRRRQEIAALQTDEMATWGVCRWIFWFLCWLCAPALGEEELDFSKAMVMPTPHGFDESSLPGTGFGAECAKRWGSISSRRYTYDKTPGKVVIFCCPSLSGRIRRGGCAAAAAPRLWYRHEKQISRRKVKASAQIRHLRQRKNANLSHELHWF